jgi:7-cyano-7-deazaguanine synthase
MSVAIVLLSGGIDSATALAVALQEKRQVTALSIDYGQRHRVELDCARRLAARYDVPHKVAVIDLHAVGGSALTSGDMALERNRTLGDMTNVPRSYVPGRNTVFLSLALAWSEVRAPLIRMSKTQVVRLGIELGVDYGSTSSCYDPAANGACASCDACVIRLAAFAELGLPDPIVYREPPNV